MRRSRVVSGVLAGLVLGAGALPGSTAEASPEPRSWVGSWAGAPEPAALSGPSREGFANRTVRMVVHSSLAGERARVRLSNLYGDRPLRVGHAALAQAGKGAASGPQRELTFGGRRQVTIPPGRELYSDPVRFAVKASEDVVVSVYLPAATGPATWHWESRQTSYVSEAGDHSTDRDGGAFGGRVDSWFFLTGLDVLSRGARGSVVVLGDSITDGVGSTPNAHRRWTDRLNERLARSYGARRPAVLNAGIASNRVLKPGGELGYPEWGESGLDRFARDVAGQTGVRKTILALGVNDIHIPPGSSAADLIAGLRDIAARSHRRGMPIAVATVTPFENNAYGTYTPQREAVRRQVNTYLRHSRDFDALIDFDAVVRDPRHPSRIRPEFDSGDSLHPNDAGYRAMADQVPLHWLTRTVPAATTH
ncbi:SGNH/GDSL hydrolase family protein [Actinomadura gamaensis]|uniref:SGNH/GDSL hydrolase family protein n=1 Tax=Actinomadura gamaensis TaxID=1763541 RepID=A0ABV9TYX4_9ACTN